MTKDVTFPVSFWDDDMHDKTVGFWRKRRFKFTRESQSDLAARRGRWLGNLISSDLSFVKSELEIIVLQSKVRCSLAVDMKFQLASDWDLA